MLKPIKLNKVSFLNRKEKWWFHAIRAINLFAYRFWWLILLLFILGITLFYLFCFKHKDQQCEQAKYALNATNNAIKNVSNCSECEPQAVIMDSIPKAPQENCRVHFSGLIMGGEAVDNNISKIYKEDFASEYVGGGFYKSNQKAFPKSVKTTFDGIAVDKGTRLIIYARKNFKGQVLLDIKGPAIINNVMWKDDSRYNHCNTEDFPAHLQVNYPQSVRKWSSSNMWEWSYGSCKIMCNE